ncbi:MAG: MerR family transcriptional regulator [Bacteroidaceae bacterium]|nr:MerR family transcriptional regulator [Bacteroidaceae bacterium]
MKKLKLYYSISEVAQIFGVSENLLRFWEQQFPTIHPRRAGRDIRQYTEKDIEAVRQVYHYLRECGMTHEGARRAIRNSGTDAGTGGKAEIVERLKSVRDELVEIRRELEALE